MWYKNKNSDDVVARHEIKCDDAEEIIKYVGELVRGEIEHRKLKCGDDTMMRTIGKMFKSMD